MAQRSSVLAIAAAAAALTGLAAACHHDAIVDARTVTLHAPAACAVPDDAYAAYTARGDFDLAPGAVRAQLRVHDLGAALPAMPVTSRSLLVDVGSGDARWTGRADVPASGPVDLLLWPAGASCTLSTHLDLASPELLAPFAGGARALVLGWTSPPIPVAAVVDFRTGALRHVGGDPVVHRAGASAAAFAGGVLLAGGADVLRAGALERSAEVLDAAREAFDGAPIALAEPRRDHAAVLLPSGEVLLVGGSDDTGAPLGALEAVDPTARRSRTASLPLLTPRAHPIALRLASGEILVAGGVDATGAPLTTLEWLAPDASRVVHTASLVASSVRAFAALPAGGALAVVAGAPGAPNQVWVLSADHAIEPAAPFGGEVTSLRFFDGDLGAPLLAVGGGATPRWLRWEPATASFVAVPELTGLAIPAAAAASIEPGLASWIDVDAVRALRFGTRDAFVSEPSPLLAGDLHDVAPDRAGGFRIDDAGVHLDEGVGVFVTDATYADVTLDLDTAPGAAPIVVLRSPDGTRTEIGGAACAARASSHLHVERRGDVVRVGVDGAPLATCAGAPPRSVRVSVGIAGAAGGSLAQGLRVAR